MIDTLDELLALHGIQGPHPCEPFRGEYRDFFKFDFPPHSQGIAQAIHAGIKQTDDIAGVGVLDALPLVGHELLGLLHLHFLIGAGMPHRHALVEHAGNHPQEGQPIPVGGVHIGLDFENEAGEIFILGLDHALVAFPGQGPLGIAQETVEEGLHAEIGDGAAKEHGGQFSPAYGVQIEGVARLVQQLDLVRQAAAVMLVQGPLQGGVVDGKDGFARLGFAVVAAEIQFHRFFIPVVNALKISVHADGPVDGAGPHAQHLFDFFHEGEGVLGGPVHFVDEGEDGNAPHAAHLEQLYRLLLHALGGVDEHNGAVRRHQHAVGILGKILVAGCIQDVDVKTVEFELHGAGRDGNAALLFDLHPVAGGVALGPPGLHAARLPDGAAV